MTITATYKNDGKEKYQSHEYHIKIDNWQTMSNSNIYINSLGDNTKECLDEMIKAVQFIKDQLIIIEARLLKIQEPIHFTIED
jgi:hypothetical protein